MKLLVFGATGRLGQEVVSQALDQGHKVTAFVRSPAKFTMRHASPTFTQGDVLDANSVEAAVAGHDAVISALGVGASRDSLGLMQRCMPIIAHAMERQHVRRLIFTSGITVKLDQLPLLPRLLMRLLLLDQMRDKKAGEAQLRASSVDWTLIYPTILTEGPKTGRCRVAERLELRGFPKVSRADVADLILKLLSDNQSIRKDLVVSY